MRKMLMFLLLVCSANAMAYEMCNMDGTHCRDSRDLCNMDGTHCHH